MGTDTEFCRSAVQIEGQTRYLSRATELLVRRTCPRAGRIVEAGSGTQIWGQTRCPIYRSGTSNVQRSTLNFQWSDRKGAGLSEYGDRHGVYRQEVPAGNRPTFGRWVCVMETGRKFECRVDAAGDSRAPGDCDMATHTGFGSRLLPSNFSTTDPNLISGVGRRSCPGQLGTAARQACNKRLCPAAIIRLRVRRPSRQRPAPSPRKPSDFNTPLSPMRTSPASRGRTTSVRLPPGHRICNRSPAGPRCMTCTTEFWDQ